MSDELSRSTGGPSPAERVAHLAATPLLGAGLIRLRGELGELALDLAGAPDPRAERGLRELAGWVALADGDHRAPETLLDAADAARRAGDDVGAARLRLGASRALAAGASLSSAQELFDAQAEPPSELLADWHLTAAACRRGDRRAHLEGALAALPAPGRDHDRLAVLLELVDLHRTGGAITPALAHLETAAALARQHEDRVHSGHVSAIRGHLLLEAGQMSEAAEVLRHVLDVAVELDDTLTTVAAASVVGALALGRRDWPEACAAGERQIPAARRRRSWAGVADGALTLATGLWEQGQREGALRLLINTRRELHGRGARAAVVLVTARLVELRAGGDGEAFDGVMAAAAEPPARRCR